ncbi:MAG: hypothetical protein ACYTF1_02455 [Planctomycetota bacterium]|jgi:hypothetical protein
MSIHRRGFFQKVFTSSVQRIFDFFDDAGQHPIGEDEVNTYRSAEKVGLSLAHRTKIQSQNLQMTIDTSKGNKRAAQ